MTPANQPTIGQEMERRQVGGAGTDLTAFEAEIWAWQDWLKNLLPPKEQGGHSVEHFLTWTIFQLRKNEKLRAAAMANFDSLMFALTDAAARNLLVGEEYWLVPFDDKKNKGKPSYKGPSVTGMPGWKGEIQQIYMSGMVESHVCEVAWPGDAWRWVPSQMRVPYHEPAELDDDPDRWPDPMGIKHAYLIAYMKGGGIQPVVIGPREIRIAEQHSRAPKETFWQNKMWRDRMIKKTVAHLAYDRLPHSVTWNSHVTEAFAVAQSRYPELTISGDLDTTEILAGAGVTIPAAVPGSVARPAGPSRPAARNQATAGHNDKAEVPWPDPPPGTEPSPPRGTSGNGRPAAPAHPAAGTGAGAEQDHPVTGTTLQALLGDLATTGWDGAEDPTRAMTVLAVLSAGQTGQTRTLASVNDLTEQEARLARSRLRANIATQARDTGKTQPEVLQGLYEAMTAAVAAEGQGVDHPHDPLRDLAAAFTAAGLPPKDNRDKITELAAAWAQRNLESANQLEPAEAAGLCEVISQATADAAAQQPPGDPLVLLAGKSAEWEQAWREQDPDGYAAFDHKRPAR